MNVLPLSDKEALQTTLQALLEGKVIVCPTDTVYGFIADATNVKAVERIFRIKKRTLNKPLGIFTKDLAMAKEYAEISKEQEEILKKHWPGKFTFVLRSKNNLPIGIGDEETIGIRIPDNDFLQEIMSRGNIPLVQTSVNISGEQPLNNANDVVDTFQKSIEKPDIVIDGGELFSAPSKIIDLTTLKQRILRS